MLDLNLNNLTAAVSGSAAAFRCVMKLQPVGGPGDKVFPPTYVGGAYAVEHRNIDGRVVRCVLLDSVQSQANRMEEALQDAFLPNWRELPSDGEEVACELPVFAVPIGNHGWVTSLTAPHRIHDAILRDSNYQGVRLRDSSVGKEIVRARVHHATAFYRYCPTVLLFGTWDSTAGEGLESAKVPRSVVSEIVGVDITPGVRTASRLDPLGIRAQSATIYRRIDRAWAIQDASGVWFGAKDGDLDKDNSGNPKKFGKGKPSDINHGNVTPDLDRFGDSREIRKQHLDRLPDILRDNPVELRYELRSRNGELRNWATIRDEDNAIQAHAVRPGGITMAYALHTWTLSLTQLRRLRFPVDDEPNEDRNKAARAVLAALAIYAFALQNRRYWLRSRCELLPESAGALEQLNVDGTSLTFSLPSSEKARQLLNDALSEATRVPKSSIEWANRVFRLEPREELKKLVELSDEVGPEEESEQREEEEEAVADASDQS